MMKISYTVDMKKKSLMVRNLRTNIQEWGDPQNPTLIMLHGWMDCGESYKFIAPFLESNFHLVAPDLRGFGETEHAPSYWFPDYFADLDVIIDHYSNGKAANLVGHSMGGNIVSMYAGIQPQKVNNVLLLESLGMPPTKPEDAVKKYRDWMRDILSNQPSKVYPSRDVFKVSIRKGNPSLSEEMVDELVGLWGKPHGSGGEMALKHDHNHRFANPYRYNFDDVLAVWGEVTARAGLVMAKESLIYHRGSNTGQLEQVKRALNILEDDFSIVTDAAHMLHIEQAEQTASHIQQFFTQLI